ncbi:MAG: nuclear transport factor 2 family protein [Balneolaceae bacterium]|nr:nuclear transport factor 2 family protein [Balneolaceae bacterium]
MDSQKKKLLEETYERIINVGLCIVPYEDLSDLAAPELMLFGTTKDEKVFSFNELDAMFKSQYEQMDGFMPSLDRKRLFTRISDDGNNAFITEEITLTIASDKVANYIYMRTSCVMEYIDNLWKLSHWHASTPVDTENDHWHLEEWKREKEKLQKLVDQQTADLKSKNRELEIEAAIERVRARTMAMKHSDELTEASEVLDQQVRALGIETWGCAFHIYADDPEGDYEWFSSREGSLPFYKTPREKFFLSFYEKGQAGETFHVEEFIGEDCKEHYDYLMALPVIGDALGEIVDAGGSLPDSQYDHVAFFKHGYVLFITYEPVPEAHDVFKRFAKVFEQTYTRFLDLQKAEEQAREAQIEAALERVRGRSMGMHKSEELVEVVRQLKKEIMELGIDIDVIQIVIDFTDDPLDGLNDWVSVEGRRYLETFHIPFIEHPITTKFYETLNNDLGTFTAKYSKAEKNAYFKLLFKHSDFKDTPEERKNFILNAPGWVICGVILKNSSMKFARYNLKEFTIEEVEIFKRLGKVFGQAYTRFLDLQRAEEQARKAEIEAALERVRARSMVMHHSTELIEVVRLLDREIKGLGIQNVDATQIATDLSDPDEGVNVSKQYIKRAKKAAECC